MHADPHQALFVLEQVDIVVAGPDSAELIARHLLEVCDAGSIPQGRVEQLVIDLHGVALPDAEADRTADVVENRLGRGRQISVARIEPYGHVAARDVEADTADRDILFVSDYAADR